MASAADDTPVAAQLERLAAEISEAAKSLSTTKEDAWDLRYKAHRAAQQVAALTQKPEDLWFDQSIHMCEFMAIRTFMDWKAFEAIPFEGSISYKDLASKLNAEESILVRLAWMLVSTGTLKQIGEDQVAHTETSKIYTGFHPSGIMFQIMFDEMLPPFVKMTEYFQKYGRIEPKHQENNPYSFGFGKPESKYWEVMNQHPERMKAFMQSMNTLETHLPIVGIYDFKWVQKVAQDEPERLLFVDVGGGRGQAIKSISKENPELPRERFMLQDRPDVLEEVKNIDAEDLRGAQLMPHDFFQTQPVKGALLYWIRRCLHDYSDDACVGILKHLAEAAAPDSKILIVEQIASNPPTPLSAYTDMCMITIGGKERSLKTFEEIAGRAGLKVAKLWPSKVSAVGVVECVKV